MSFYIANYLADNSDTELYANHSINEENQENPIEGGWVDTYDKEDFLSEVYMTSEKYDILKGTVFK